MDLRVHAVGEFAGRGSRTVRHHLPEALVVRDFIFDGHWIPPMPPRPPGQADPAPGVSTGRHRPLSDLPMPHRARTGHLLAIAAQATAHCSPPTYPPAPLPIQPHQIATTADGRGAYTTGIPKLRSASPARPMGRPRTTEGDATARLQWNDT